MVGALSSISLTAVVEEEEGLVGESPTGGKASADAELLEGMGEEVKGVVEEFDEDMLLLVHVDAVVLFCLSQSFLHC